MKHWNIAFSPLVQFACPTLEDARAIAEEAWTGYVDMKKDWIGEAETREFVKLFESFQLLVPDFFPMSQSCEAEHETWGKDCVSAVYELTMNRICIYVYIFMSSYICLGIYNDIFSICFSSFLVIFMRGIDRMVV